MKIETSPQKRNMSTTNNPPSIKRNAGESFSASMDMEKREHRQQNLNKQLEKIKKAGEKLKVSKNLNNIADYKKYIREYLNFVLENYYELRFSERYRQILSRVEIINQEVEELTKELLLQQKSNIDIISKVDRIAGLLVDLFV